MYVQISIVQKTIFPISHERSFLSISWLAGKSELGPLRVSSRRSESGAGRRDVRRAAIARDPLPFLNSYDCICLHAILLHYILWHFFLINFQ